MHNNAFYREGGGGVRIMIEDDVHWAEGQPLVSGTHNWLPRGSTGIPRQWDHTLFGVDPGFVSERDLRLAAGSPLIAAGSDVLPSPPRCAFPSPLVEARSSPPIGHLEAPLTAVSRGRLGAIDIGAFAYDARGPGALPNEPEPPRPGHPAAPPLPIPPFPWIRRGACGCDSAGGGPTDRRAAAAAVLVALVFLTRRQRRRSQR